MHEIIFIGNWCHNTSYLDQSGENQPAREAGNKLQGEREFIVRIQTLIVNDLFRFGDIL